MESRMYLKNSKISPKKLRFLVPKIKKMAPQQALDYLMYSPLKGSKIFHKAIKSAITSATATLKSDSNLLKFKVFKIDEGQKLKRYRPGGKGTPSPYVRRMAHITIVLEAPEPKAVDNKQKIAKELPVPEKKIEVKKSIINKNKIKK